MKISSIFLVSLACMVASTVMAAEPMVWTVSTKAEVLKGDARGVSIGDDGSITLAPRVTELFKTGEQYIWSSVSDATGNVYLGTGGDGKVYKVDGSGKGSIFTDLAEMNVTALALATDGGLFAATSPDGKVYRVDRTGSAQVYFDPKEKYIWSLAVMANGSLAVGTGDGGRIYLVNAPNAEPAKSILFDTSEAHIISLTADKNGNLYAGTDASGLVLRFGSDGKPFALLDSPLREVHDVVVGRDGSVYALLLGESASAPKPAADAAATTAAATVENKTVSLEKPSAAAAAETPKSRYDLTGAKSAVYRILPDGASDLLWASPTIIGFSLANSPDGVYLGTSDKGRVYNIDNGGRETLVLQTNTNQVSTLLNSANGLWATSSNPGSLFKVGPDVLAEGTYESAVLDAKSSASWGRLWWRSIGNVTLQTRTGNTDKPDETWSGWSASLNDQNGGQVSSPTARYLQWRAVLRSPGTAVLNEVSLAFIGRNIAPEILSLQVLPTNVGLAANPPVQIDPNIEIAGMDPATFGIATATVAPRKVYQRGATSLQWTAEDRNGDRMVYDVFYKRIGETDFRLLKSGMTDNFFTIDGQSLSDGRYVFRVVAKDDPSNPGKTALRGEKTSEPINIDNTPPLITQAGTPVVTGERGKVVFDAVDAASYINRAEYSVNGGDWVTLYADDGIADSPRERFTIDTALAAGENAVTIRVWDVNGNAGNARAVLKR